jgi:predicted O-methyltransferase YrrM
MPEFKYDWFSCNIESLMLLLERFKGKEHIRALEIGCFDGRSTVWFLENILTHGSSSITCIDHFKGGKDHEHFNVDISGSHRRFLSNTNAWKWRIALLDDDSHKELVRLKVFRLEYEFIYIDGSHLAADVLEDAVLSWRLLKPGGIMIFDDYDWKNMPEPLDNPGPGIDAFLSVYAGKFKELSRGHQVAIEKL